MHIDADVQARYCRTNRRYSQRFYWTRLEAHGSLTQRFLVARDGLNVKRSSFVCALLARLPGVRGGLERSDRPARPPVSGAFVSGRDGTISVVMFASVTTYLDGHQGTFTALLTAALIAVTIFYAIQNRRMAVEMTRAREQSILPKLALEFHRLGPTAMTMAIKNVGPGAAFDIDGKLLYDPMAGGHVAHERRWRQNILGSGEQRDFLPPGDLNDNLNSLPATYRDIRLIGAMRDAAGVSHEVNESFPDLASGERHSQKRDSGS